MNIGSDSEDDVLSDINVTPFIDVMLVLLVIFMVTAPLIQQGIAVQLPESKVSQPLPREEEDIIVTIKSNGKVLIDKYSSSMAQLQSKLTEIFRERREKRIFIRADRNVSYGVVVRVMGIAKAAGIERVGMVTDMPTRSRNRTKNR